MTTYKKHKAALKQLRETLEKPSLFIHYSCESFYDYSNPSSRRVTSIAIKHHNSSQTHSFSLHLAAERLNYLTNISEHMDQCEKEMLNQFYEFISAHRNGYQWVHWNMRDANYGFAAINHRFSVLGGTAIEIEAANKIDLSPLLIDLYGKNYTGHPRMQWLVQNNNMHRRTFLNGEEEAAAYEQGNYVALHQSTLLKVQILSEIAELALAKKLKTLARWRDIHATSLQDFGKSLAENWVLILASTLIGLATAVAGVATGLFNVLSPQ